MTAVRRVDNLIDGKFVPADSYLDSFNPATEEVIAQIADGSPADADQAVQAARRAFPACVSQQRVSSSEGRPLPNLDGVARLRRSARRI